MPSLLKRSFIALRRCKNCNAIIRDARRPAYCSNRCFISTEERRKQERQRAVRLWSERILAEAKEDMKTPQT